MQARLNVCKRFIPTRVGNTRGYEGYKVPVTVHPHACGEYTIKAHLKKAKSGSSPRVWGIRPSSVMSGISRRFIPTRVGNTHGARSCLWQSLVHPHACGEYSLEPGPKADGIGSSPRVWGIRLPMIVNLIPGRFIPTRVGNTATHDCEPDTGTVHPHACGEYVEPGNNSCCDRGSSPRVWGIRGYSERYQHVVRFIPTRVGNT